MSNGINKRQNEDNSIAMLAAQRQLYRKIEKLDIFNIFVSVVFPFIISLILIFFPNWDVANTITYILSIVMLGLSIIIENYNREKKEWAASIQQTFDVYVYNMPWDKALFGEHNNLTEIIAEQSKVILKNEKERKELLNWYTPKVDELPIEKGILACQRINHNWDVGLRKRYKFAAIIMVIVLTVIIIGIGVFRNEPIQELLARMVLFLPMLHWLIPLYNNLGRDVKRLDKLDKEINSPGDKDMEALQLIQKSIFEHRKNAIKVPDGIYKLFKDNDEDKERRIVQLNL